MAARMTGNASPNAITDSQPGMATTCGAGPRRTPCG